MILSTPPSPPPRRSQADLGFPVLLKKVVSGRRLEVRVFVNRDLLELL